ncbi:sugar porter family MFS transporter [candidate division KSB1 bacterium]|nr:sugar porter family MFS transporter [candidate division KSB1 bacterium]
METQTGRRTYIWSVSLVAALGGLLFGYDTAVISGAIGFLKIKFSLDPTWEGWTAASALVGCILGVSVAGVLSDRFGRKKTLILAAIFFLISAIWTAIPKTLFTFIVFRMTGGVGVGIASMTSPLYIAEISPAKIRGRMVSVNQFAIISGMVIIYFINYFIANSHTEAWNIESGWRWMFGSESVPAVLFLLLLFLVPESPRWLTKNNRRDAAFQILSKAGGSENARRELIEIEKVLAQERGSLAELLQPGLRNVLILGSVLAVLQQVTGINVFLYYAPEIFKKLGAGSEVALLQTIVVGAVNMLFTIIAIWTVDRIGRKPLMLLGAAGMGLSLLGMGLASQFQYTAIWILIFILGYIACFALSVGPVTWVILSEIFPNKIRGRAMSIATFWLWTANFVVSQTFPMLDENRWLITHFHHAFPFYIYGILCGVLLWVVWRFIPETKGQSLEAIEQFWLKKSSV